VAFLGMPGLALLCMCMPFFAQRNAEAGGHVLIGWGLTLGVPFGLGLITGLLAPTPRWIAVTALSVLVSLAFLALLFLTDIAGVFCLTVFASSGLTTGLLGAWIGFGARCSLLRGRRARSIVALFGALLPYGLHAAELAIGPERERELHRHERVLRAPLARAWGQSLLTERDERPTSGWFHLRAPRAREASGHASQVGDEKTIRYQKGLLRVRVERVEQVEDGRELVLRVLEQRQLESKALRLHQIRITCRALDGETTEAAIEYEFTPLMTPRWTWRPLEHFFGGIAVEHALDLWQEALDEAPTAAPELDATSLWR
jgi:hypothetical protein